MSPFHTTAPLRYLSVCSGIEAASVAWHPLGWKAAAFAEIEPFPSAVLAHHWPDVPNLGDLTKHHEWPDLGTIDLLVGGTPCQAFSVAGLRAGLADPRGNLTLTFLGLVAQHRPHWMVWENVPGVLSDRTNAFGQFLAGLAELGYGWAYRVLDAQYFGVAQRRRRVFVVGCLGDWRPACAVLFERESLRRDPPPRRETRERLAPSLSARTKGGGGLGTDAELDGALLAVTHSLRGEGFDASDDGAGRGTPLVPEIAWALQERDSKGADSKGADSSTKQGHLIPICQTVPEVAETLLSGSTNPASPGKKNGTDRETLIPIAFSGRERGDDGRGYERPPQVFGDVVGSIDTVKPHCVAFPEFLRGTQCASAEDVSPVLQSHNPTAVAFAQNQVGEVRVGEVRVGEVRVGEVLNTLNTNSNASGRNTPMVQTAMQVRRLTPRECERLQGFPDDYTLIPWRGKEAANCPDGPRYKSLGNSMAVPVMHWIGQRIAKVDALRLSKSPALPVP